MKLIKKSKKGLYLPVLALSLLQSYSAAMEGSPIDDSSPTTALRTLTVYVTPEVNNNLIDETTDDETRIYLPEPEKKEKNDKNQIRFMCTYEGCNHASTTKSNLSSHINLIHSGIKRYKCIHCKYAAYYMSQIRAHTKNRHKFGN